MKLKDKSTQIVSKIEKEPDLNGDTKPDPDQKNTTNGHRKLRKILRGGIIWAI